MYFHALILICFIKVNELPDSFTPSTHIFKHPLKRTTEFKVLLLLFLPNFTPFPGNRMVQEVKKLNSQYNSAIFSTLPANRMVQYAKS